MPVKFKKQKIKTARGRKTSSTRWLQRHINDPYVHAAEQAGYRSRAAFKLDEIDKKYRIIDNAKVVIDLGCAPGSWLQLVRRKNKSCRIVGVDLKEVEPIEGVHTIQSDIRDEGLDDRIAQVFGIHEIDGEVDLILNDMAPNTTGHRDTDYLRILSLVELVTELCDEWLAHGGSMVSKIWRYGDIKELMSAMRQRFESVNTFKPKSSYSDSAEIFLICQNCKKKHA